MLVYKLFLLIYYKMLTVDTYEGIENNYIKRMKYPTKFKYLLQM